MSRPPVFLLTCPPREASAQATLARFAATDWSAAGTVVVNENAERDYWPWGSAARSQCIVAGFALMLETALRFPGADDDWMLFLEDDIAFHPRLGSLVAEWAALRDPRCALATLFNPSLQATAQWGEMPGAFAAKPETFLGAQALLLRRRAAARALAEWDTVPGMQAQRLAKLLGSEGPIWVHRPSLVQHVAEDSGWGARVQRALDFGPVWPPASIEAGSQEASG